MRRRNYSPPWITDPNITAAWDATHSSCSFTTDPAILNWLPSKGSAVPNTVNTLTWQPGFAGATATSSVRFGASARLSINSLAAGVSGIAKPWTMIFSGQMQSIPSGGQWFIGGFGHSTTTSVVIGLFGNASSNNVQFVRWTNAATFVVSTAMNIGTSKFVVIGRYDGTNIMTRLNGATVDTALPFSVGATTVDKFNLGCIETLSVGLFAPVDLSCAIVEPMALPASSWQPIETYLLRRGRF